MSVFSDGSENEKTVESLMKRGYSEEQIASMTRLRPKDLKVIVKKIKAKNRPNKFKGMFK